MVIATGDADALQLVTESVSVLTPLRGFSETVTYDPEGVRERYGIDPVQIPGLQGAEWRPVRQHQGRAGHRTEDGVEAAGAVRHGREAAGGAGGATGANDDGAIRARG